MNSITKQLLQQISDWDGNSKGAYHIRENNGCASRQSSEYVTIEEKKEKPGINIRISGQAQNETIYIPACVTKSGVEDLVYNDFLIEDGAVVTIIAGCGVHTEGEEDSRHNGIHRFFIGKHATVSYQEKHIGTGTGTGARRIDPITEITMNEDSYMEINTIQISGVTTSDRSTTAHLAARAKLTIHERMLTEASQTAKSDFSIFLDGEDSGVNLISRSVAKGHSMQEYHSVIQGSCRCTGHSECDAILAEDGMVNASPALFAGHVDASLIHEAAIGKIAGEQIIKLCTLGLTKEQAEQRIIEGFLK